VSIDTNTTPDVLKKCPDVLDVFMNTKIFATQSVSTGTTGKPMGLYAHQMTGVSRLKEAGYTGTGIKGII
jgi:hypothetical protein